MSKTNALFARRQRRTRHALRQAAGSRPRLSVFRSGKHIYAQVIDDQKGATLASASSLDAVFDRGGYMYHGRVAALATAAREGGLSF